MFKLWARKWKDGHLMADMVVEDSSDETRTHKVFHTLDEVCHEMDLAVPQWLQLNIKDFQRHARCRFTQDSFAEEIDFDYLEIQILEEDEFYN